MATSTLNQWLQDWRWAENACRARRYRSRLGFRERLAFDDEIRPIVPGGCIDYPDALYHITVDDLIRAMWAAAAVKPIA